MFESPEHVKESDAVAPLTAYADVSKTQKKPVVRRNVGTVGPADADWVTCMQRIHTRQDKGAFAALFRHFAPRVKAFLMKSGADASMAEECTQEVMATVWRKAHMFDPSRASVATWIFTIARNRKIDALRKQRRPEPEDLTWGPEAEPRSNAIEVQINYLRKKVDRGFDAPLIHTRPGVGYVAEDRGTPGD